MSERKRTAGQSNTTDLEALFLSAHEEHADAVFRHVLLRVRDRERALDISQEAFTRTWLYLSKGNEIEHIKAFLFRVANNLIVDYSRKKKEASLDVMMEDEFFEVKDESIRPPLDTPAIKEALRLLDSLDEIYRTAVTMRFIDELSPKEIAQILQVSENTVSVRIHRGIERLQAQMREKPGVA